METTLIKKPSGTCGIKVDGIEKNCRFQPGIVMQDQTGVAVIYAKCESDCAHFNIEDSNTNEGLQRILISCGASNIHFIIDKTETETLHKPMGIIK